MEKLHHIALTVTDIGRAVDWYTDRFDIRIAFQDTSWALLSFENIKLALVLPAQHPAHIAVNSADAAQYGPLNRHRDGTASAYAWDPWGNMIEYLQGDDAV